MQKNQTEAAQVIPGFGKYAVIENKMQVINVKTGNVQNVKASTRKYQLFNDKGERKNISWEDIVKLFPKKIVTSKATNGKKPIIMEDLLADAKVKKIMAMEVPKHRKIYELDQAGYTNKEIQLITGSRVQVVSRDLWMYKTGKLKAA
jgi:hypothetical protein